jgi:endonuclease YncB( thermonuclease family)
MDRTRIRLHGIDAPEKNQPYGSESTAALAGMVERSVYVLEVDVDRYGRLVGQLYHSEEGYDINASLVCAGFAWWYERYAPNSKILKDCHSEAQQASRGLWRSEEPVPPWEWRRR